MNPSNNMHQIKDMGAASTGFHDWYFQRISAALLLILLTSMFALLLLVYAGRVDMHTLHLWLTHPAGKIISSVLVLTLMVHVWTGLKVIIEDYIHKSGQRMVILNLLLLGLLVFGLYFFYHIWAEVSYTFSCIPCTKGA